jgi:serine phosphatase RsbU (regulator of sigma subunit)
MPSSERVERQLDILLDIANSLSLEIRADDLLRRIVSEVSEVMESERSSLFLHDRARGDLWSKVAEGMESSVIRVPVGVGLAGACARDGESIFVPDAYDDPRFDPSFDRKSGFRTHSVLCAPIRGRDGRLLGVLQTLNRRGGGPYTLEDEKLLRAICSQVAIALERTELIEQQLAAQKLQQTLLLAREIQMGLLPGHFPGHPAVDLYAMLGPAMEVGGDLYDWFFLDDDRLCFMIGDVAGKGVPSALFMAVARAAFKIIANEHHADLGRAFSVLNRFLKENNASSLYVTMFAGVLHLRTGAVNFCDAGHVPPLLVRRGQPPQCIEKQGGMVLSLFSGFPYSSESLTLRPGDRLVMVTDGVTEAENDAEEFFGEARAVAALEGLGPEQPASAAVERLLDAIRGFAGETQQSDDITIVSLTWRGPAQNS